MVMINKDPNISEIARLRQQIRELKIELMRGRDGCMDMSLVDTYKQKIVYLESEISILRKKLELKQIEVDSMKAQIKEVYNESDKDLDLDKDLLDKYRTEIQDLKIEIAIIQEKEGLNESNVK